MIGGVKVQVTLQEILLAREERAKLQRELLAKHGAPLISFTMNIAGPIKTSLEIERAFDVGLCLIERFICSFEVLERIIKKEKCGPVAIFSVRAGAKGLKRLATYIEEEYRPIGRLFDIDVIDTDGTHLSRKTERGCLVCGAPGRACAAGRLHPVSQIVEKTNEMLAGYFNRLDASLLASLAKEALEFEVNTYPKPGLVDPVSAGSHSDLTVSDFMKSAEALVPCFFEFFSAGVRSRASSDDELFFALRRVGLDAERRMYAATDGKNTHKGAIFSFGIILGALGRIMRTDGVIPPTEDILKEAARISKKALSDELFVARGATAGERAYIELGIRGARGEAMDGFPSVQNIALPVYRAAIAEGKNENGAGALTLLYLIANVYDTCLYSRGGSSGVEYAMSYARRLIEGGEPTAEQIEKMDREFKKRNLSPGGCADLLALTYFLYKLETCD